MTACLRSLGSAWCATERFADDSDEGGGELKATGD